MTFVAQLTEQTKPGQTLSDAIVYCSSYLAWEQFYSLVKFISKNVKGSRRVLHSRLQSQDNMKINAKPVIVFFF